MFAELSLASAFAALLMFLPLVYLLSRLTQIEMFWTIGIHDVIAFAWWCMAAGVVALIVFFSGLIRTFIAWAWTPFFVELR
jgi:hypothetical protein